MRSILYITWEIPILTLSLMKTVGKQLQEARLAKNWTPELAARETKIKVDRLHDLETDDYSHFTSPTYARGFVRTYARSLGLDEYQILRQLDSKLPDDDSANIVTDSGVAYLPETSLPPRAAHQDYTGLYIVMGLAAVVTLVITFILFEAYRVGELSRWFGSGQESVATDTGASTNAAPGSTNAADAVARAQPIDGSAPPSIETPQTNAVAAAAPAADTNAPSAAPRAMPVDGVAATSDANAAPPVAVNAVPPPRALPVDPNASVPVAAPVAIPVAAPVNSTDTNVAPRALPVTGNDPPVALPVAQSVAMNSVTPPVDNPPPVAVPSASSKFPNAVRPVAAMSTPQEPAALPIASAVDPNTSTKPLILTASQDSFVRVTLLDSADADKPVYASVLRSGQSVAFSGHKFSINVGVPSAVDIKLDGVNYGPHSDGTTPETFTVQSHVQ
jgi:cytoskeleton protein RodZ